MRAAGLEPLEPYRNSRAAWRCRCLSCGREVTPRYGSVAMGQGGCVACGNRVSAGKRAPPASDRAERMARRRRGTARAVPGAAAAVAVQVPDVRA